MRVVCLVLLFLIASSTSARAEPPVLFDFTKRTTPLPDDWWKWPTGLGIAGGAAGAGIGFGGVGAAAYLATANTFQECRRDQSLECEGIFAPEVYVVLLGIPAGVALGALGAVLGALTGASIAYHEEPPAVVVEPTLLSPPATLSPTSPAP